MHPVKRGSYLFLAVLMSFTMLTESLAQVPVASLSRITPEINTLLPQEVPSYASYLKFNQQTNEFVFNEGYTPSSNGLGTSSRPQYTGTFPLNGSEPISITDPTSSTSIAIKPLFDVGDGQRDSNRLVYPLPGRDAIKVVSLAGIGYKEDIILNSFQGDALAFSYELELPNSIEARLERDGSIGFYGVSSELLGNITTSTEKDAKLLEEARSNAVKNTLLYKIPAPYIIEYDKRETNVDVYFELDGDILTTKTTNLRGANYPLTIDPSVYVETARKFMRGNNESNVDFDVDNELIQKGTTTGARFDSWAPTLDLPAGRFDGASTVAGGYTYYTGGVGGDGVTIDDTIAYVRSASSSGTSTTMNIGTAATNRLVLVMLDNEGEADDLSSVTVAENDCSLVQRARNTDGLGNETEMWYCDEGDLGASNGSVTISATGGDGGWGIVTHLYTGVDQSGPFDSEIEQTVASGTTISVENVSVPEDGLVVMSAAHGGGGSITSFTSPLIERTDDNALTSSAVFATASAVEAIAQVDKTYVATTSEGMLRATSIVASWDHASTGVSGSEVREDVYWANIDDNSGALTAPNPGSGACASWCSEDLYDLPEERRAHSLVAYNGFLYVIGGEDSAGNLENTIYIAKIGANGEPSLWHPTDSNQDNWVYWYSDTSLPNAVRYSTASAYNNRLYFLGGETAASTGGTGTVLFADIQPTGTLGAITSNGLIDMSTNRHQHTVEIYNDVMYVIGGDSSSSGTLLDTVEYVKLASDGTFRGSWESTESFSTARRTNGGDFTTIYGAYMYIMGGCTAVSGGDCDTVGSDIQLASINADGSLSEWGDADNESNNRVGYGLHAWRNHLYRLGGCSAVIAGDSCSSPLNSSNVGEINQDGDASTVSISEADGQGDCVGADPFNCDLPSDGSGNPGDDAGEIGHMLNGTVVVNGFLYAIGGCPDYDCRGTNPGPRDVSANVAYAQIASDGSLRQPATCIGDYYGAWCVDDTNVIYEEDAYYSTGTISQTGTTVTGTGTNFPNGGNNTSVGKRIQYADGTTAVITSRNSGTSLTVNKTKTVTAGSSYGLHYNGTAAPGMTTFNGQIYVIGGLNGLRNNEDIFTVTTNADGSLAGNWDRQDFDDIGVITRDLSYTYAFTRANPNEASTYPGNLFIVAGCGGSTGASCSGGDHRTEVYKCNILPNGSIEEADADDCTTAGQLQMPQGISLHAGTIYANYIYVIGGFTEGYGATGDRDTVYYARIDDNNDIVPIAGETDWELSPNLLSTPRRRGSAFGYNGYIYAVGGYDDSDESIIADIEFAKVNVSDGSIGEFAVSDVTVNQRWGLSMAVSNSYAYVIGGCNVGPSPGGCSSFEPSVQTFQLYNNDSGAIKNYTESTGDFATTNDRIGSSAVILDGYIYVAGGETGGTTTSNVQFAELNPNGTIGTWADTTATLPSARAYGQLEVAGGSLYYIGGEDDAGDEKSEVYYATPTATTGSNDVIRTTSYKINSAEFTGTSYTLSLNQDLESEYFVMVNGSDDSGNTTGAHNTLVRVTDDPFGNIGTATASDEISLERGNATDNWVGTVTVVECVSSCSTDGFVLNEVLDTALAGNNELTDVTLGANHSANTVPFGGLMGGGISTAESNRDNYSATVGVRLRKNSTNQIRIERMDDSTAATAGNVAAADLTTYVVTWGSAWSIDEVNFDDWNAGGGVANTTGNYTTQTIGAVDPDNTWIWKSAGTSEDNGLGDGAFGKVVTLGDGVTIDASETEVALGSLHSAAQDVRDDTVYVMEHPDLAVDHRFLANANQGTSFTQTVNAAIVSETVSTLGNITSSEGYRVSTFWTSDNGTGTNYPRPSGWGFYHSNATTISYSKGYGGNNQVGWIQSVDFGNNAGSGGGAGDISTWATASNGLPGDRTRHGAAVWNDRIFVTGGLNDSNNETNTIYTSPQLSSGGDITSAWASDTDVFDVARSGGTAVAYANNLYILGGNDGTNFFNDVQFTQINSDGTLDEWRNTASLPRRVSDSEGFAANGFIYLVGGRSDYSQCSNNTYVAPISANTTIASGNNPTGTGVWFKTNVEFEGERHSAAVTHNEGKVYVLGGGCETVTESNLGTYTFDADNDADESAWTFTSSDGSNGLNPSNTSRSWSHETGDTPSGGVGPSSGEGGNPDGYIYTEATSGTPSYDDVFTMTNDTTIDASTYEWNIDFSWNQRGDDNHATLELQTNEASAGWVTRGTYGGDPEDVGSDGTDRWNRESVNLASVISNASTEVRFVITFPPDPGGGTTFWHNDFGLDTISLNGLDVATTEQSTTQHYYGTIKSQPQIARYSYYVDADSNVAPNAWLLNGVDNNIGARWQFAYRSSIDGSGEWGVDTNFGDVTLGSVEDYTPFDESGLDTNFARYFYVTVSIDASQTYGYPDDVSRGPTVDDMTIFFVSDPNKRLRHGKTFIQGTKQPLDTPPPGY